MSKSIPPCRTLSVHTFQGDRRALGRRVRRALHDQKFGLGAGPTRLECLLYAGHTGISSDADSVIYGFNPEFGRVKLWEGLERLRNGDAFPGVVLDDTRVFDAARKHRLMVLKLDVVFPALVFGEFERQFAMELKRSRFTYGFPNGDGDCNCITWLERLALPLLTGSMSEFAGLAGFSMFPKRRFGRCH